LFYEQPKIVQKEAKMLSGNILRGNVLIFISMASFIIVVLFSNSHVCASDDKTIVELWDTVKAPAPVELKVVKLNPQETAFLILDMEGRTGNSKDQPRCVASVSKIKGFLDQAKGKGVAVVYSLTRTGKPETILPDVAPVGHEPIVKSSVDKFFNTDLEKILLEKGIKTVVIAGTTAEGAVLHTATGAAIRGLQVIVPIDGMSAGTLYAEQYTAWHLINAPGSRQKTTLTRFDMIGF
jgi:nicotinamidase-related amidase